MWSFHVASVFISVFLDASCHSSHFFSHVNGSSKKRAIILTRYWRNSHRAKWDSLVLFQHIATLISESFMKVYTMLLLLLLIFLLVVERHDGEIYSHSDIDLYPFGTMFQPPNTIELLNTVFTSSLLSCGQCELFRSKMRVSHFSEDTFN